MRSKEGSVSRLVAIAYPHSERFIIVSAEPLDQTQYKLLEDCAVPGYNKGCLVEEVRPGFEMEQK